MATPDWLASAGATATAESATDTAANAVAPSWLEPHTSTTPAPQAATPSWLEPHTDTTPGQGGKTLSFQDYERLWVQAGGRQQDAHLMAHVGMAESSGNPNAVNHYTEGGKAYTVRGPWQVSSIHGGGDEDFDPLTNAKKAVGLFAAQHLVPWESSRNEGGGGGWGQYLYEHVDPFEGSSSAGGAGPSAHPATPAHVTPGQQKAAQETIADTMRKTAQALIGFTINPLSAGSTLASKLTGVTSEQAANTVPAPVRERLSGAINRVGTLGDDFTYAPANALARDLGGDHDHGIVDYAKMLFDPGTDAGATLDRTFGEYGFNSPGDVLYWAGQPGVRDRLAEATPQTPWGMLTQLALGMHADLARLKPNDPYLVGAETAAAEYVNPSYLLAGEVGSVVGEAASATLRSARAGAYGAVTQDLAQRAAQFPIIGNRFTKMGDAFGYEGENLHARAAQEFSNNPHIAQHRFTSEDTYGGAYPQDQIQIKQAVEEPNNPQFNTTRKIGNTTIIDRAQAIGQITENADNELKALVPEMAAAMRVNYSTHGYGLWDLPTSGKSDPRFPDGVPSAAGQNRGPGSPFAQPRIHDTISEGQAAGLKLNPDYIASGADAMHHAKVLNLITLAQRFEDGAGMTSNLGKPGVLDIEYKWPHPNGAIQVLGKGRAGFNNAEKIAGREGANAAAHEAQTYGNAHGWKQDEIDARASQNKEHYTNVAWDKMRTIFRSQHPTYDFDTHASLGIPDYKGRAGENALVESLIDSHPQLSKLQRGEGGDRFGIHTQDLMDDNVFRGLLDNFNSIVRQGILSNVAYHPAFNLVPLALNEGISPLMLARALGLDPSGAYIPQALLDRAAKYGATAPKFGSTFNINPMTRAKLLSVPYDGLSPAEMSMKAINSASKWNADVTFGYFEDRIAAVTMKHYEDKGMSPDQAARETRKTLGDYQNMTATERGAAIRNWHYFYTWMRGQLRYWSSQALTAPQKIMAPLRGVQTANQQQGDSGSEAGSALSLRSALDSLHHGWGTDARGNPKYVSLPFPQFRYGADVVNLGSVMSGDPNETGKTVTKLATSSMPPLAQLYFGIGATNLLPAQQPQPWNPVLWDKDAPSPAAKWGQAASKLANDYLPGVIRAPLDAIAQHDPVLAAGAAGPGVYSSPNLGSQSSKTTYRLAGDLRSILKKANDLGNHSLSNEVYDLMLRVNDGDPMAQAQAKRMMPRYLKEVGTPTGRKRFSPRV